MDVSETKHSQWVQHSLQKFQDWVNFSKNIIHYFNINDVHHMATYMRQTFDKTLSTIYHFILKVFRKQKEIFKI